MQIEQQQKEAEKRNREQLEAQMIMLEEEDHKDLKTIMSSIKKDSIPEDMIIFWEQQQKMLETKSSKGYRWHPR